VKRDALLVTSLVASVFTLGAAACGTARSADVYRSDTERLLATHNPSVKHCYDAARATDQDAAGIVTVAFTVEHKTGAVTRAELDAKHTTAPDELGRCVLQAVQGLVLDPPDRHDGVATFVYEFRPPAA
jgi:hypothetical protein